MEAALKAFFTQDPRGALAVYLFGSVARGEAHADSDVDVGVLFASDPPATLAAPQFTLEAVLERPGLGSVSRSARSKVRYSCGS